MSAVVIVILAVVAALIVAAVVYAVWRSRSGGADLQRRFGPEYDRALERNGGDTKATERELQERMKKFGSLETEPLREEEREQYLARWAAAQQQFVDSPRQALIEVDRLVAGLAQMRGYPSADRPEHMDALSVQHGHRMEGYRKVREAAHGGGSTEGMRDSMLQARALFDALAEETPTATMNRRGASGTSEASESGRRRRRPHLPVGTGRHRHT